MNHALIQHRPLAISHRPLVTAHRPLVIAHRPLVILSAVGRMSYCGIFRFSVVNDNCFGRIFVLTLPQRERPGSVVLLLSKNVNAVLPLFHKWVMWRFHFFTTREYKNVKCRRSKMLHVAA